MKDISSILLVVSALLSLGIRLFKKADVRLEPEPPKPVKKNRNFVSVDQEEESEKLSISETYADAPSMTEEPAAKRTTKTPEMPEKPSISDDFDLAKAVIYSEILKTRKFDEY